MTAKTLTTLLALTWMFFGLLTVATNGADTKAMLYVLPGAIFIAAYCIIDHIDRRIAEHKDN